MTEFIITNAAIPH